VVAEERGGQGRHRLTRLAEWFFFLSGRLSFPGPSNPPTSSFLSIKEVHVLLVEFLMVCISKEWTRTNRKHLRKRKILYHSLSTIFSFINAVVSARQDFPPVSISWIHRHLVGRNDDNYDVFLLSGSCGERRSQVKSSCSSPKDGDPSYIFLANFGLQEGRLLPVSSWEGFSCVTHFWRVSYEILLSLNTHKET